MLQADKRSDLHCGDSLHVLRSIEENSIDAIVTDPPYGLAFMGSRWDYSVPSVELWAECLRVLKPGGNLLAFAGTRTQHRMAVGIEDAGFEIRDMIAWVYGSGFPKSLDIGKAVKEREGWGTALKPALEPITLARKPLAERTVVNNVLKWGTAGLNINDCRIDRPDNTKAYPANFIHDGSDEVVRLFPVTTSGKPSGMRRASHTFGRGPEQGTPLTGFGDTGSAARFFYCAKAARSEREAGLEGLPAKQTVFNGKSDHSAGLAPGSVEDKFTTRPRANSHPTVKPIMLMRYLCRLVTPPHGLILDPFMGSGTTGCAAALEGFHFIGIELDVNFIEIARHRIAYWSNVISQTNSHDQQKDLFDS